MAIQVRKQDEIFHIKKDWFEGYWHFSFGSPPQGYYDPDVSVQVPVNLGWVIEGPGRGLGCPIV